MRYRFMCALAAVSLVASCGSLGTVGTPIIRDSFEDVAQRAEAYSAPTAAPGDAILVDIATVRAQLAANPERVAAAAIIEPVTHVCEFHNASVKADGKLTELQRRIYTRSAVLLVSVLQESAGQRAESRPSSAPP